MKQVARLQCCQRCSLFLVFVAVLVTCIGTQAQTTQARTEAKGSKSVVPPPDVAYNAAVRPLEITRSAVGNWSEVELAALATTTRLAASECAKRRATDYSGEDLFFLARLCSAGQDWENTRSAASRYIRIPKAKHLAMGYAYRLQALLGLGQATAAVSTAKEMLGLLPYDGTVSATIHDAVRSLELEDPNAAIEIGRAEIPYLLRALERFSPAPPDIAGVIPALKAGTLYGEGMHLAALLKFSDQDTQAGLVVSQVRAALAANRKKLGADDMLAVENADTQYELIGARLPSLDLVKQFSKYSFKGTYGAGTVLLVYPDWCLHCAAMTQEDMVRFAVRLGRRDIRAYGIVIQTAAEAATTPDSAKPSPLDQKLAGTPSSLVVPDTQRILGAVDFPLALVTDNEGIVRIVQPVSETAFAPGGYLEKVVSRIAKPVDLERTIGAGKQTEPSAEAGPPLIRPHVD